MDGGQARRSGVRHPIQDVHSFSLLPTAVECLPTLQHDPNRPEDVLKVDADEDGFGGDDAADACRYLVASKPRAVSQRKLAGF
jgi:hypothetical protein